MSASSALRTLGASTREAEKTARWMVIDQLRGYLGHGNIGQRGQLPGRLDGHASRSFRIAIATPTCRTCSARSRPRGETAGLNIQTWSPSRAAHGLHVVDVDSAAALDVLEAIRAIDGVTVGALPARAHGQRLSAGPIRGAGRPAGHHAARKLACLCGSARQAAHPACTIISKQQEWTWRRPEDCAAPWRCPACLEQTRKVFWTRSKKVVGSSRCRS